MLNMQEKQTKITQDAAVLADFPAISSNEAQEVDTESSLDKTGLNNSLDSENVQSL